ncbi:hypothetical protein LUZ61_005035 [Rhynchospora tenuis]|uniref:Uncharacterized protein n=1 Tax=Rhynchospora tenuis TaxID=198213 RepID=A0AAD5ZNV5_9POAL|nr:hypothetical protein LUZ61_005035 [Rhynchospora tenuis]
MSIIFTLLFLLSCISSTSSTKDDEIALLKIKKQLGDPDILSSWVEDLSSNYLTGTIPHELVHGNWAATLNLSNNRLTGELPRCGWDADFWLIDVGNNLLSGDASFLFKKRTWSGGIVLANNEFEFDLSYVENIPENIYNLNISHNKIYGKIPYSFVSSHFYDLDLSFNKLCGEIPQGGNLWEFNSTAFANNTCLCGYPLPPCSTSATAPAPILEASLDSSP